MGIEEEIANRIARDIMGRLEIKLRQKESAIHDITSLLKTYIQEDVYDVYEPYEYERRGIEGGLLDKKNIEFKTRRVAYNGDIASAQGYPCIQIKIRDVTPLNFGDASEIPLTSSVTPLASLINYGWGNEKKIYEKPRPFFDDFYEEIKNGDHIKGVIMKVLATM